MAHAQRFDSRKETVSMLLNERKDLIEAVKNMERVGEPVSASFLLADPKTFFSFSPSYEPPKERNLLSDDISKDAEPHPVPVYCDLPHKKAPPPPPPPPQNFTYIVKSEVHKIYNRRSEGEALVVKCKCVDICDENCECVRFNERLNNGTVNMYNGALRIVKPASDIYSYALVVCGELCGCSNRCPNRIENLKKEFQFQVVRRDKDAGFGVMTMNNIAFGEFVMEFVGEVVPENEIQKRGQLSKDYAYELANGEESDLCNKAKALILKNTNKKSSSVRTETIFIDGSRRGNLSRFILNGCFPNLQMLRVIENRIEPQHHRLFLYALHDIPLGTELTIYYGNDYLERKFECKCETLLCARGRWTNLMRTIKKEEIQQAVFNIVMVWRELVVHGPEWKVSYAPTAIAPKIDVITLSDDEETQQEIQQSEALEEPKSGSDGSQQPAVSMEPQDQPEDSGEESDEEDITEAVQQSLSEDGSEFGGSDGEKLNDYISNEDGLMVEQVQGGGNDVPLKNAELSRKHDPKEDNHAKGSLQHDCGNTLDKNIAKEETSSTARQGCKRSLGKQAGRQREEEKDTKGPKRRN